MLFYRKFIILALEFSVLKGTNKFFCCYLCCPASFVFSVDVFRFRHSAGLSGSESDLDFDNIFGESSYEEDEFEGFVNQNIPTEIQRQWSQTADNNRGHFTEFNPVWACKRQHGQETI